MFEKEAEEYTKKWIVDEDDSLLVFEAFKDGAEFGYNKANEWHYVKDGDLPKENTEVVALHENGAKHLYKWNCGWKSVNKGVVIGVIIVPIIAWKEIVLPELKESE